MKNQNIIVSIIIIIVVIGLGVWIYRRPVQAPTGTSSDTSTSAPQDLSFKFDCTSGNSLTATFHLPADTSVDLALSDGRSLSLPKANTPDGATYENADGSIVFSGKNNAAYLTENGKVTYDTCTVSDTSGAAGTDSGTGTDTGPADTGTQTSSATAVTTPATGTSVQ